MVLEQFEDDFFKNIEPVHLECSLLNDQWEQLKQEITENGWTNEEALQYFITMGLMAIKAMDEKEKITSNPDAEPEIIEKLQQERMVLESRYAVMRYRAYHFMQAVKTLEMKYNSAMTKIQILESLNDHKNQKNTAS